jgi:hypothetical protein
MAPNGVPDEESHMSGVAKTVLVILAVAVALNIILFICFATCGDCLGS